MLNNCKQVLKQIEDLNEMEYDVVFHQGLRCLQR